MGGKDLVGSKSFWGTIIMLMSTVGPLIGKDFASVIGDPTVMAAALAAVGGFIIGLIGILKRDTKISSIAGAKNPLAP